MASGNLYKEIWLNHGQKIVLSKDQNDSHELEQPYERGDLQGEYRLLAVDTQTDHFRYIVRGFDRDNKSYLIDYGSVAGFKDLDEKFAQFHCSKAIIDCGWR